MTNATDATPTRRTALLTGAAGGIGQALARALSPHFDLVLSGRDVGRLEALRDSLGTGDILPLDLSRPETLQTTLPSFGTLDLVVHNAGVVDLGPVGETSADVWTRTLAVNVVAPAELTRLLLPALRAARGHVVFVNSGAGLTANPGWGSYAASKFALRALADALRAEESSRGVRVTTVYPGRTATDMQRKVRSQEGGDYVEDAYIRPESIAAAVLGAVLMPRDALVTEVMVRPGI